MVHLVHTVKNTETLWVLVLQQLCGD